MHLDCGEHIGSFGSSKFLINVVGEGSDSDVSASDESLTLKVRDAVCEVAARKDLYIGRVSSHNSFIDMII